MGIIIRPAVRSRVEKAIDAMDMVWGCKPGGHSIPDQVCNTAKLTVDLVHLLLAVAQQGPFDPIAGNVRPTQHHIRVPPKVDQERLAIKQLVDEQVDVVPAELELAFCRVPGGRTSCPFIAPDEEQVTEERCGNRHQEGSPGSKELGRG